MVQNNVLYNPQIANFPSIVQFVKKRLIIFTENDILAPVFLWRIHTESIKSVDPTGSQDAWWPLVSFEMQTLSCCFL